MKLINIIERLDKSQQNEEYVNIEVFSNEFDFSFECIEQDRLKSYWMGNWCCTDTWVGHKVYFLDDEPMCISSQKTRKTREIFKWISKEAALTVKDYLISLMLAEPDEICIQICDINEDMGYGFKIHFNNNVIDWSKATLKGEPVKVIERIRGTPDYGIDEELRIELNSGETKVVNISDLDFKFNTV